MLKSAHDILILYGSQTGQSEAIAKLIEERCEVSGIRAGLFVLNDYQKKFWLERESLIVVVCSSTGDGEPPENALRFVRGIAKLTAQNAETGAKLLQNTEFALLGLGDSNFSTFQGAPRTIEKHLLRLGARKFIETGVADDQVGLELVVEPWIDKLFGILTEKLFGRRKKEDGLEGLYKEYKDKLVIGGQILESMEPNAKKPQVDNDDWMYGAEGVGGADEEEGEEPIGEEEEFGEGEEGEEMDDEWGDEPDGEEEGEELMDEEEEELPREVILRPTGAKWPESGACLIRGSDALRAEKDLRVPVAPIGYLTSCVTHERFADYGSIPWQNGQKIPAQKGGIVRARVVGTRELTRELLGDVSGKMKREIEIDVGVMRQGSGVDTGLGAEPVSDGGVALAHLDNYEPGDALYFLVENRRDEVNFILQRVNLLLVADQQARVVVHPHCEKKTAVRPSYIPENSSLRYILTVCLDIRRTPGRPLLRMLAEYAEDEKEKRRLLELCSAQGTEEFMRFIREPALSLADVLFAFPSCRPPIERLFELLPRLLPRPYSVSSWHSEPYQKGRVRFTYSMMKMGGDPESGRGYERCGAATDYLRGLRVGDEVQVMLKESGRFRLPTPSNARVDVRAVPLIMIGPGTGVAPFLAFLQKIMASGVRTEKGGALPKVERELYFGCKRVENDCIYRDEMLMYEREGVLSHLTICESKPPEGAGRGNFKYVQEAIEERGEHIYNLLGRVPPEGVEKCVVYVCGDAKGMSIGIWKKFIEIVVKYGGKSEEEAKAYMEQLKKEDRYIEDVWA